MDILRIPEQTIDQILRRSDIVQIVSNYVKLEKKGKNYFGLCPFHSEKTPSFSVSPEKQIFHCFSCGEGGNAAYFVSKIEKITWGESIRKLASQVDVDVSSYMSHNQDDDKYYKLNQFVSDYYQFALENTKEGHEAKAYLHKRGIHDDLIKQFKIGLAPDSVDSLYQALRANQFSELLMVELGHVIKTKQNRVYDKFKNRIMFPIVDEFGNVLGFSGRLYKEQQTSEPKYINTQETPVFKKSEIIYNLANAKKSIKAQNRVLLYEGFMDVIASYKAGIEEAVATMGTALTLDHIQLLKKLTNNFVLCYDGDKAGVEATKRALESLKKENVTAFIVEFPDGLDPDDFFNRYGDEKYRDFINNKQQSYKEYIYRLFLKKINLNNTQSIVTFKNKVFQLILNLSKTEQEIFLKRVSEDTRITFESIRFDFDDFSKRKKQYPNKFELTEVDQNSFDRATNDLKPYRSAKKKLHNAERIILYLILKDRKYNSVLNDDDGINFDNPWHRKLFWDLHHYYGSYPTFEFNEFKTIYINQQDDYLDFFTDFYQQFQNFKFEDVETKHFDQAINVVKTNILLQHAEMLKEKFKITFVEEEQLKITQQILEINRLNDKLKNKTR